MPSVSNVRVNTVQHTEAISKAGKPLQYVEITGFDAGTGKGFKKRFFATKQDGTATMAAEVADGLNSGDWAAITMDDTSFKNVTMIKPIAQPADFVEPDQGGAPSSNPTTTSASASTGTVAGSGGTPKKFRSVAQLNREVALGMAVKVTQDVNNIISIACKFEDYLVNGVGEVDGEPRHTVIDAAAGEKMLAREQASNNTPPPVDDSDIPF